MRVLILGGTRFIGRHIAEALLAGGHRVSVFNRGQSPDELSPQVERLRGDRDDGAAGLQALSGRSWDVCVDVSGTFNLAGPRLTWTDFLRVLGASNLVWVSADILKAAGVTEFDLPLFRPERGKYSGLMDVSAARAHAAGLCVTDPEVTANDVRAWIAGSDHVPALPPHREHELIELARQDRILHPR